MRVLIEADMGFAASEIADWFEAKRKTRERDLEEWVVDNPQWWAIGVATVGASSMEFLGTYVDLLRLGEGASEGGVAGYGTDVLRLVSIVPVGRLVRMGLLARRSKNLIQNLRVAAKVKGVTGPCTFQAVNNAMQIVRGKSIFVTVREMARATGQSIRKLPTIAGEVDLGAWVDDLVAVIRTNGGRVKLVTGLSRIEDVVQVAAREPAPVIFAFHTTVKTAKGTLDEILHSVIAVRDKTGAVHFADYGGRLFPTLDQLVSRWGTRVTPFELASKAKGAASAVVIGTTADMLGEFATHLQRGSIIVLAGMELIETQEDGADLAFPATLAAVSAPAQGDAASATVVTESFDNFARRKTGDALRATRPAQAPALTVAPVRTGQAGTAPRSDWLTGVQFRLNHLGFAAGRVDGINGPLTEGAVRAFQRHYPPLAVDGIPGPKTQAKLVAVCGY